MAGRKRQPQKLTKQDIAKSVKDSGKAYSDDVALEVCSLVSTGMSLLAVSRLEGMPAYRTMMQWNDFGHPCYRERFAHNYARARDCRTDALFDTAFDLLENVSVSEEQNKLNKAKAQVDLIKWGIGKMSPKKYGDRLALGGENPGDPIKLLMMEIAGGGKNSPQDMIAARIADKEDEKEE